MTGARQKWDWDQWQKRANKIKPLLPCSAMKFIFQPDASKPSL